MIQDSTLQIGQIGYVEFEVDLSKGSEAKLYEIFLTRIAGPAES